MIILGTNSIKDTGYDVGNSVRMSGSTVNLQRDFSGDGNRRTWTYSTWFKLSNIKQSGFFNWGKGNPEFSLRFESTTSNASLNQFRVSQYDNSQIFDLVTTQYFRDPSAWGHMVVAFDTTQGTASNRIKIYFNGTQITSFSTETYPDQNFETFVNQASKKHYIGYADYQPINGYLCETVFIDGQQLAPDQFGEFDEDSGIWKPIDVSGLTFGTNGFYLETKQSGTSQNSSGLGADTSGNDNHFAVNNLTAVDQSTDTCTNNFATWNSLQPTNATLTEGNLVGASSASSGHYSGISSIGVSSGKWYFECKQTQESTANEGMIGVIIFDGSNTLTALLNPVGRGGGWGMQDGTRGFSTDSGGSGSTTDNFHAGWTDDDIIGIALDIDNSKLYFSKNGQWNNSGSWDASSPTTSQTLQNGLGDGTYFFMAGDASGSNNNTWSANFGSPAFAISSGNTDGEGLGNFEFAVPSGYFALCTKNLAEYG